MSKYEIPSPEPVKPRGNITVPYTKEDRVRDEMLEEQAKAITEMQLRRANGMPDFEYPTHQEKEQEIDWAQESVRQAQYMQFLHDQAVLQQIMLQQQQNHLGML